METEHLHLIDMASGKCWERERAGGGGGGVSLQFWAWMCHRNLNFRLRSGVNITYFLLIFINRLRPKKFPWSKGINFPKLHFRESHSKCKSNTPFQSYHTHWVARNRMANARGYPPPTPPLSLAARDEVTMMLK